MKLTIANGVLLAVICVASPLAAARTRESAGGKYDFYQVSVQATHCRLRVSVNGVPSEELSLDATHGGAVSMPMGAQDLKSRNTITIQVDESDENTSVSLNVVGITQEREVVSTDEPGNVANLDLDATKIAAAKVKKFSVRFKASLHKAKPNPKAVALSEPVSEEEARAYGKHLSDLFRNKDKAKLIEELLPRSLRSPEAKGLSEAEVRQRLAAELTSMLDENVFLEDKGLPIEVELQTSKDGPSYDLRAKNSHGLIQFYAKADREKKLHTLMVLIVKLKGTVQVADLGAM